MKKTILWALLWGTLMTGVAQARDKKTAGDLRSGNGNANGLVTVVVQRRPGAPPLDAKILRMGGNKKADHNFINAQTFQVPRGRIDDLAEDADVKYISPDRKL